MWLGVTCGRSVPIAAADGGITTAVVASSVLVAALAFAAVMFLLLILFQVFFTDIQPPVFDVHMVLQQVLLAVVLPSLVVVDC